MNVYLLMAVQIWTNVNVDFVEMLQYLKVALTRSAVTFVSVSMVMSSLMELVEVFHTTASSRTHVLQFLPATELQS